MINNKLNEIKYIANIRIPSERAHSIQILKMCEAFAKNGFNVELVYPFRFKQKKEHFVDDPFKFYGISPIFKLNQIANIDIIYLEKTFLRPLVPILFIFQAFLWGLYAVLKIPKKKGVLIFTRCIYVAFWTTLFKIDTFYEVHTIGKGIQTLFYKLIMHSKKLKKIICITTYIKNDLIKKGFYEKNICVQPDSVDLDIFKKTNTNNNCKKQLGFDEHAILIGYIGSFSTMGMEKGIKILLRAFASDLLKKRDEVKLVCVGGPMKNVENYLKLAEELCIPFKKITFHDRVPHHQVPNWIKACDILTIPWEWNEFSAYFTSPLKLFEYMASGNPIIASDLPSIREILSNNINGFLIEPGNPEALVSTIDFILNNGKIAKKIANRALIDIEMYTWQKRATSIMEDV